jgi:hypothetical protein
VTEDDAKYYAKTLTEAQREVILLCSVGKSWGYSRLAEKTGRDYAEVRAAGQFLQSANLATVEPVRLGNEYNGSAIFLNARGEQVRLAASRLRPRK